MNIFSNNKVKSAKEHIINKRNQHLYIDLSNNVSTNLITCIKNKTIVKVNNHENLINLTKGYFSHNQNNLCKNVNTNLTTKYDTEKIISNDCPVIKNTLANNMDVSGGYVGVVLVNQNDDTVIDSTTNHLNHYAEQTTSTVSNAGTSFTYQKKETVVNCIKMHTSLSKNVE